MADIIDDINENKGMYVCNPTSLPIYLLYVMNMLTTSTKYPSYLQQSRTALVVQIGPILAGSTAE